MLLLLIMSYYLKITTTAIIIITIITTTENCKTQLLTPSKGCTMLVHFPANSCQSVVIVIGRVVLNGERPSMHNKDIPVYLRDLLLKCWNKDAIERPDFGIIVKRLEDILY